MTTPSSIRPLRRTRPSVAPDRYSRTRATAAVTPRAAISAAAEGRVSPASTHRAPATIHRRVSTQYSDQAASAVNRVSVYAIDWTNAVGYTPHSAASTTPARRPYSRAPTAKIPQAASSPATQATSSPAPARPSGVTSAMPRSSAGSSGKKARSEWTPTSGSVTVYP